MVLLLAWAGIAFAGEVGLDRVELLSDASGTFLLDEVPMLRARPGVTGLRYLAQVEPVIDIYNGLTVGVSLGNITVGFESPADKHGLGGLVAVPTRLGLPTGVVVAGCWRRGPLWVDMGLSAQSGATWAAPEWQDLRVRPVVGVGVVPPRARRD